MATYSRPEDMNTTSKHVKVGITTTLADPMFVAGEDVCGKMEMECRTDKGLGLSMIQVELIAIQELTSRDHSATSTFLHTRTVFQGGKHGPSNAVYDHPQPGEPPLPPAYYQAKKGSSTFFFKLKLPESCPSSISFGSGLARVRYEVKASVQVIWKGKKETVANTKEVEVIEAFESDFNRPEPQGTVVSENGKIWTQGRLVGPVVVAGESSCIEFAVKNHSQKRNTGITVTVIRSLHLPGKNDSPLQISDTLTSVSFRGPEYIINPGVEGIATLVFDVPIKSRGVKGGLLQGEERRQTPALFEVRCAVVVKMTMGMGTPDIIVEVPVTILHPMVLPPLQPPPPVSGGSPYHHSPTHTPPIYHNPSPHTPPHPYHTPASPQHYPYYENGQAAYGYPSMVSPPVPYVDQNLVYFPPPSGVISSIPQPNQFFAPPPPGEQYYYPPPPAIVPVPLQRPSSAGQQPETSGTQHYLNLPGAEPTGKGQVATRISRHLKQSSRNRSASPAGQRNVLPAPGLPSTSGSSPIAIPVSQSGKAGRSLPQPPSLSTSAPTTPNLKPGVLHSPRPMLSPKQSYAVDLRTQQTLPKSERVEDLERMAEEVVGSMKGDLSHDVPRENPSPVGSVKAAPEVAVLANVAPQQKKEKAKVEAGDASDINKTLPSPPQPTAKPATSSARPRVDDYFSQKKSSPPAAALTLTKPADPTPPPRTPPTPTLQAVTSTAVTPGVKAKPSGYLAGLGANLKASESGLDALEKRLLAEVGTRKIDVERRPHIKDILGDVAGSATQPISVPTKPTSPEAFNDSAISSLNLPDQGIEALGEESDGRTHRGREGSETRKKRRDKGGSGSAKSGKTEKDDKERKARKRKEKEKEAAEMKKMRQSAKGRVAAWLGGVENDVGSDDDGPIPVLGEDGTIQPLRPAIETTTKEPSKSEEDVAPNPRSSGFVPINTFKREFRRTLAPPVVSSAPADEARRVTDLWSEQSPLNLMMKDSKAPAFPKVSPPMGVTQSIHTDRKVSPPSFARIPGGDMTVTKNPWASVKSPAVTSGAKSPVASPPPKSPLVSAPTPPVAKVIPKSPVSNAPPKPVKPERFANKFLAEVAKDPEVKYDVRSARGGRGGKVTAVAALWASGAPQAGASDSKDKVQPSNGSAHSRNPATINLSKGPETKPKPTPNAISARSSTDLSTKAAEKPPVPSQKTKPNLIKSTSVPAILSSSHATPTLSSTASLARPSPHVKRASNVLPAIGEATPAKPAFVKHSSSSAPIVTSNRTSVDLKAAATRSETKSPDTAFGQARLRDLIKKYQGQASK